MAIEMEKLENFSFIEFYFAKQLLALKYFLYNSVATKPEINFRLAVKEFLIT
jgi:hypothetical protein